MTRRVTFRTRRAFTLVEVLAVVVVLGFIAASVVGVWRVPQADAWTASRAVITTALRQARSHAERERSGIIVHLDRDGLRAESAAVHSVAAAPPPETWWQWRTATGAALSSLAIDRAGRSADVVIDIDQTGQRQTWWISGITGQWRELTNADAEAAGSSPSP